MGQPVTWIVPYKFTNRLQFDIDFSVMNTFLEFYIALLRFVNFKLFSDVGLEYPPQRMDLASEDQSQLDVPQVMKLQEGVLSKLYSDENTHMEDISSEFKLTEEYAQLHKRET
jgi:hypothetical protein